MILKKLRLKDFRGYEELEIDFHPDINVIIGKNDVGKSTILDALNIFFNDDVKPEISDCNIKSESRNIEISATFEMNDEELIIIDATNPTSLREEYLLNKDGLFEVLKRINTSGKSITANSTTIHINANYPYIDEKPLITYKSADLKKILEKYQRDIVDYDNINKTKKADMRKALFNHLINNNTIFEETLIHIKDIQDDDLKTWEKIKSSLPLYTLFQSDRSNTDGDKEVQDPMKAITKEVIVDLHEDLEKIKQEVVDKVEAIGKETLEKLKEFNVEIAKELKTIPELKNWDSVFKFNLGTDDDIPLNKRGSGVRRLILLSYFRAQAEKNAKLASKKGIIYAIEEPETSQHPDYQKMLIDSLIKISEKDNYQVFLTTHTPEIAKMVAKENLIMIKKNNTGNPVLITDNEIKLKEIIETLGILPTIHSKVVVCVEGKHDTNFLKNINATIAEFKDIINITSDDVRLFEVGGSKLINWINENYFRDSGIKEFHLYDSDIPKYVSLVEEMNNMMDRRRIGRVTSMREMENYIPRELIEEHFGCDLSAYKDNWSNFDVPDYLKNHEMLFIEDIAERENAIKGIINNNLAKKVTVEMLKNHGVYDEIKSWFELIKECIN